MATPNQTDEGWNQQAAIPTQKISWSRLSKVSNLIVDKLSILHFYLFFTFLVKRQHCFKLVDANL
jgi:hypothetical protein